MQHDRIWRTWRTIFSYLFLFFRLLLPPLLSVPSTIERERRLNGARKQYDGKGLRSRHSTRKGYLVSLLPSPRDLSIEGPRTQKMGRKLRKDKEAEWAPSMKEIITERQPRTQTGCRLIPLPSPCLSRIVPLAARMAPASFFSSFTLGSDAFPSSFFFRFS